MAKAMAAGEVRAAEPVVRPLAQSEGSAVEAESAAAAAVARVVEATLAMAVDLRAKVEAARAKVEAATVHPQQDLALTRAAAVPSKLRLCQRRR